MRPITIRGPIRVAAASSVPKQAVLCLLLLSIVALAACAGTPDPDVPSGYGGYLRGPGDYAPHDYPGPNPRGGE